ncbi:hypothetical protein [Dickeya dadantii]|uniref:hypothetical protein n=2 Tax=Dickeya dadantii TaxID=204038 RepID=UPI0003A0BE00|nr:hypothetical protein [Dickeya dadantii]
MMKINHNPEIWLQAADDAAESFLSQPTDVRESGSDNSYTRINVLSSLEALADAVYYLNHNLCIFIKNRANQWYRDGMMHAPEFAINWAKKG